MKEKTKITIGFIAIVLASFLAQLDTTIVNIALPKIGQYMKASINTTSWITSIYALVLAILLITASKLADQFGRKKFFLGGLIIFAVSSIACSISNSIGALITFRAVQGIGAAILIPIVIPMAVELVGSKKNAMISAAFGASGGFAAAVGGPLGGFITEYFSWRWIFLINVPLCLVVGVITVLCIKESYDEKTSKQIDFKGISVLSVGLFLLVFALIKTTDYGITSPKIIAMYTVSVILLGFFIYIEKKAKAPMLELALFSERNFRNSTICIMFLGIALAPSIFLMNYFMNDVLGFTSIKTGITLCTLSIVSIIFSIITPMFYKKVGYRIFNIISMVAFIGGNYLLSKLTFDISQAQIIRILMVLGLAMGCGAPALIGGSLRFVKDEKAGIASGVVNMSRQIGVLLGIAIFVSILNNKMSVNFDLGKKDFVSSIQTSSVLDNNVKTNMIKSVNNLTSESTQSNKKAILARMDKEKESTLKTVPTASKVAVAVKFETEKIEISKLIDNGTIKLKNKSTEAFNFTFLSSSIFLLLSLFFAFRTGTKKTGSKKNENLIEVFEN